MKWRFLHLSLKNLFSHPSIKDRCYNQMVFLWLCTITTLFYNFFIFLFLSLSSHFLFLNYHKIPEGEPEKSMTKSKWMRCEEVTKLNRKREAATKSKRTLHYYCYRRSYYSYYLWLTLTNFLLIFLSSLLALSSLSSTTLSTLSSSSPHNHNPKPHFISHEHQPQHDSEKPEQRTHLLL